MAGEGLERPSRATTPTDTDVEERYLSLAVTTDQHWKALRETERTR